MRWCAKNISLKNKADSYLLISLPLRSFNIEEYLFIVIFLWWLSWLGRGALFNVDTSGCDTPVLGLIPQDRAQVGIFASCGTVVPKGFLAECAFFSTGT